MSDPLSSGAGKVAEEMLKEVQTAIAQADQVQSPPEVAFNEVLQGQRVGEVQDARLSPNSNTDILRVARRAQAVEVPAIGESLNRTGLQGGIQRIMEDVMQGQNKLEEIISLSLSGRSFSTPELLAMQAGVYRFTQELELTSKVVEKATATVKQTMNTQV
ncbi:MAG: hypothetical protein AAF449_23485 [Myxococcota bacterium]